jgi:hypothetical protein
MLYSERQKTFGVFLFNSLQSVSCMCVPTFPQAEALRSQVASLQRSLESAQAGTRDLQLKLTQQVGRSVNHMHWQVLTCQYMVYAGARLSDTVFLLCGLPAEECLLIRCA